MPARPAFAFRDLSFGLAALALGAAIVLAATSGARKRAQLAAAQNQLRWIAGVTGSYAADFEDRMWGLSWEAGVRYPFGSTTFTAPTGLIATAHQAIDILRRRGRPDMPVPPSWYAPSLYSHLPLLDYLDRDAPDTSFVSPGDEHRLNWTKDPQELHDRGFWYPYQVGSPSGVSADQKRWPYSSSFQAPAAITTEPASGPDAVTQGSSHYQFDAPQALRIRAVAMPAITYPSQKVLLHESATWYVGSEIRYFAHRAARVNVLTADGAGRLLATSDANRGWRPRDPASGFATGFSYQPSLWEGPPPLPGEDRHTAHYRFTRGGPAGRDFGGPEVDTGQP